MTAKGKAWSKQTDDTLTSVCENLRNGVPFARSCKVSGISESTGHAWRSEGWDQIQQNEDLDSDEVLSFPARFALEVEIAARDFMAPMIEKIRDGAVGKGRGDWRAAHAILNSLFPHEFSEKVATAKSARVEVSGQIDVAHEHGYREFLHLRNMTTEELAYEIERVTSRIDLTPVSGAELDGEIAVLETKLNAMKKVRAAGRDWVAHNWIAGREPAVKPAVPAIIDLDEYEIKDDPAALEHDAGAPIGEGVVASVQGSATPTNAGEDRPAVRSSPAPPLSAGIAFDVKTGQAYHPPVDDGDLSL